MAMMGLCTQELVCAFDPATSTIDNHHPRASRRAEVSEESLTRWISDNWPSEPQK